MNPALPRQPHTPHFPCPVCGGHRNLRHGQRRRCAGFSLDLVIYCSREEWAGSLPIQIATSPPTYLHRRSGACGCGREHGTGVAGDRLANAPTLPLAAPTVLPVDERHRIYHAALDRLTLRPRAREELAARGLSSERIAALGFRSIPRKGREVQAFLAAMRAQFGEPVLRQCPGFVDKNERVTFRSAVGEREGYLVPYRDEYARITGLEVKILGAKHETLRGTAKRVVYNLAGPDTGDLYLTEGGVKGIVASELLGIRTFATMGQSLDDAHIEVIRRLDPQRVIVALDQEANAQTEAIRQAWLGRLARAGLPVYRAVWDGEDVGGPKGLDDLARAGERPRLRAFYAAPAWLGEPRAPRPAAECGVVERGGTLQEVRATVRQVITAFLDQAGTNAGRALVVAASAGSGKSRAAAEALRTSRAHGRILVGTRSLATQIAGEYGFGLFLGRDDQTCAPDRLPVVRELERKGVPVAEYACGSFEKPRCPYRRTCPYWRQMETAQTWVGTTEQLFNRLFLTGGSALVVDDGDLPRALFEQHHLRVQDIDEAIAALSTARAAAAQQLLALVQHAIVAVPSARSVISLQGAAAWDHLARTARQHGQNLAELIAMLPPGRRWILPRMDDRDHVDLPDTERIPPMATQRLCELLARELAFFLRGGDFNSGLRFRAGGVDLWRLREPVIDPRTNAPRIQGMPLLVLDATPVEPLLAQLTRYHERLPDVRGTVTLPPSVHVIQRAGFPNGITALRDDAARRQAVLAEVAADRERFPVAAPDLEAIISYKSLRDDLRDLRFAPDRILNYGGLRGTNRLAGVERMHLVGRPMPPGEDLLFRAAVLDPLGPPVSPELVLRQRRYGGHPHETAVIDYADPRVSTLLRAAREDEMLQALHRARLVLLPNPESSDHPTGDGTDAAGRAHAVVIIHSSHPVDGLRVDDLLLPTTSENRLNAERADEARRRILRARIDLEREGEEPDLRAIARRAGSDPRTVAKCVGTSVETPSTILSNRLHNVPHATTDAMMIAPGTALDAGHAWQESPHDLSLTASG